MKFMRILIDIGHPAHVHYFKNFIWEMEGKGHRVIIVSRDKEVAFSLLDYYKLPYSNRGKGKNGLVGKLLYIIQADLFILRKALKVKPDVFLSAGSIYAAHVAWLLRKPHIALDDTDHNAFQHLMYVPFTSAILTPEVFQKNFGKKHVRFDGFLELASLHPKRFIPKPENTQQVLAGSDKTEFVILRFVSWDASHDIGLKGLTLKDKYSLVNELSKYVKVIISSEAPLPDDLRPYSFSVHPALMHDVLHQACLLVSESLTMSAEAAFLGTPALCISTAQAGTLDEEVKLGLIELYRTSQGLVERAIEIVKNQSYRNDFKLKSRKIVSAKVDVTALLVSFVENYPVGVRKKV
jgi:uncharacterized protein